MSYLSYAMEIQLVMQLEESVVSLLVLIIPLFDFSLLRTLLLYAAKVLYYAWVAGYTRST